MSRNRGKRKIGIQGAHPGHAPSAPIKQGRLFRLAGCKPRGLLQHNPFVGDSDSRHPGGCPLCLRLDCNPCAGEARRRFPRHHQFARLGYVIVCAGRSLTQLLSAYLCRSPRPPMPCSRGNRITIGEVDHGFLLFRVFSVAHSGYAVLPHFQIMPRFCANRK